MKQSVIPLLACPHPAGTAPCGGMLALDPALALPLLRATDDADDVLEGRLICGACGTVYPILSGVAVLAPLPQEYLRRYHGAITRDLRRHGALSPEASHWLARQGRARTEQDDYGADFRFSQQFEDPWDVAQAMTGDPTALYGPFAEWLRQTAGQGPYDVLAAWAREYCPDGRLVLDAGCGGGGLLARIAPRFAAAFGVDLSFLAVLLARRAVLHRPEPERTYLMPVRRGQEVERPLALRRADNTEVVVGDCGALPFAPALFDAVCSSNVIDIAGLDASLGAAARVLRPGGILLLSDPFYFREGEAPPGEPRAALHAALARAGLAVAAHQDAVPWAWATYDRHWRLYFNYCVAARRA
jgi:SAM-dependent methyltransferase/uncharacterized protein YbaR (Trm112 family)